MKRLYFLILVTLALFFSSCFSQDYCWQTKGIVHAGAGYHQKSNLRKQPPDGTEHKTFWDFITFR